MAMKTRVDERARVWEYVDQGIEAPNQIARCIYPNISGKDLNATRMRIRRIIKGERPKPEHPAPFFPSQIDPAEIGHPATDEQRLIQELKQENDRLKLEREWLAHSSATDYHNGTLTVAMSDLHFFDRGFLLRTWENLKAKTCALIGRYKPRRVVVVINGDIIGGRGIYRNQHTDNVLSTTEQQIKAGMFEIYTMHQQIEAVTDAEIEYIVTQGNHDYSMGDPTAPPFVWGCRTIGLPMRFVGTETVMNVADNEADIKDPTAYNILFEHGWGGSQASPTSPAMILATLVKIIGYSQKQVLINRVCHGHVHWRSVGLERARNMPFDVTGGLQRNDRASIGKNTRPVGWIAYLSPPDSGTIIRPIEIVPDDSDVDADIYNPQLPEHNRASASRAIQGFEEIAENVGALSFIEKQVYSKN